MLLTREMTRMSNKCQINQTEAIKQAVPHLLQRLLFQPAPLLELLGRRRAAPSHVLLLLQAAGGHLGLLVLLLPLGLQQPSLPQGAVRLVLERQEKELFPSACFGM